MYHFTYWLEHFKELPLPKTQTIIKNLVQLSEKTATACSTISLLADCSTLSSFNRARQAIIRAYGNSLSAGEKKSLALFGEFLEFKEYSHFKFPEAPKPLLAEYCKNMQMSYSYKAVLIHELVCCGKPGITTDELTARMIQFYRERIDHGQVPEKDGSVFAKAEMPFAAAKRTILSNPVDVLSAANVIIWNKRTGIISFSSEYAPTSDDARNDVCAICKDRLRRYYAALKPATTSSNSKNASCSKKLITLLKRLEGEIQGSADKATKKRLMTIYGSICAELGIAIKSKTKKDKTEKKRTMSPKEIPAEYTKLDSNDERKIGTLVQETLASLEKIEYRFTRSQLENFQSREWSLATLKLNYAFIKLVDESKPIQEQRIDHLGNGRYYSRIYTFAGKKYLVTSQWYAKSKPLYISWYNSLRQKIR